jgi:1,4-alpha-glucan branching enzyme
MKNLFSQFARYVPCKCGFYCVSFTIMKSAGSSHTGSGYLMIMLHAHLPYIRYPEHENFLEENWLYEAMTETYIPLITILEDLVADGVDFRISLSLTPPLLEMLHDDLLMSRYQRYLSGLIELSGREIYRNRKDARFREIATIYRKRFLKTKHLFEDVYRKDLITAFRKLMESGNIEIATCSATHAYLPALMAESVAAEVQIQLAVSHYKKFFKKSPPGIWLPECGFTPAMDTLLKDAGLGYFFLESHGVVNTSAGSRKNIYTSVKTPGGITAFARDNVSSRQVWSSHEGYPGDPDYRDFYRDIGFDLDFDYISPYLPDGIRTFTGLKYYRITNRSSARKKPYSREKAIQKAKVHAADFVSRREKQILSLNRRLKISPLITSAFDAELFGHWWFEGPEWLNQMLRRGAVNGKAFRFVTPSEFIAENPATEVLNPALSSWGQRGYSSTWIGTSNSWVYKHMHKAAKRMCEISAKNIKARGWKKRALNQAARELLLAQASDWAFMIQKEKASKFATRKFTEHLTNFSTLYHEITSGRINRDHLAFLERKNNIFSDIDFRIYSRQES